MMAKILSKAFVSVMLIYHEMAYLIEAISPENSMKTISSARRSNAVGGGLLSEITTPAATRRLVTPVGRTDGRDNSFNVKRGETVLSAFKQMIPECRACEKLKKYERKLRRMRKKFCNSIPGLVSRQYKICMEGPELVATAIDGTTVAIEECKRQFKFERWNCSLLAAPWNKGRRGRTIGQNERHVLAPAFSNATREAAFVDAILSAGVVHAVTSSCRKGELPDCHCDNSVTKLDVAMGVIRGFISSGGVDNIGEKGLREAIRNRKLYGASTSLLANRTWMISRDSQGQLALVEDLKKISWGGCSDDVRFGMKFSRKFLEAPYKDIPRKSRTMNDDIKLHNLEVGRRVVQDLTRVHCRCHGMTGSCASQTCWMQMPTFEEVGNALKRKYMDGAVRAEMHKRRRRLRHVTVNSYDIDSTRLRKVPKSQLAFLNLTPNLCSANRTIGVHGTAGRQCLKNSDDRGDCRRLCCGRGYNVKQVKRQWSCKCKFYYCCKVECETCTEIRNIYTCRP